MKIADLDNDINLKSKLNVVDSDLRTDVCEYVGPQLVSMGFDTVLYDGKYYNLKTYEKINLNYWDGYTDHPLQSQVVKLNVRGCPSEIAEIIFHGFDENDAFVVWRWLNLNCDIHMGRPLTDVIIEPIPLHQRM